MDSTTKKLLSGYRRAFLAPLLLIWMVNVIRISLNWDALDDRYAFGQLVIGAPALFFGLGLSLYLRLSHRGEEAKGLLAGLLLGLLLHLGFCASHTF